MAPSQTTYKWPSPRTIQRFGPRNATPILCLAGFGDDSSMFLPLKETELAQHFRLVLVDLPGFGDEPPFPNTFATISNLAGAVTELAAREKISIVLAHSVASVIACFAARQVGSTIRTILSLEGNLTTADTYYTQLVEEYEHPEDFHAAFLDLLAGRAETDPLIARYHSQVARAHTHALWILGMEMVALSEQVAPGQLLQEPERVHYFYNPENCADLSLAWLKASGIPSTVLPGASHWPTMDAPKVTAEALLKVLR
jgi:pimeloyl-ACP methyl ester carboxylesterase